MKRLIFLMYGLLCHGLFLLVFAYLAAFVGGFLVPITVDSNTGTPLVQAVVIDVLLVLLFGVQHSVMARPRFKAWFTRVIPAPIERSTYVLASCVVLVFIMWQWRAIDTVLWDVENQIGRVVLWTLFAAGWLFIPLVSMMINHFDLFGTRQVWLYYKNRPYSHTPFEVPYAYKYVRHPLYLGFLLGLWATPTMTVGHVLFSGLMTLYILVGVVYEERDLIAHFGDTYRQYAARVPKLIPMPGRRFKPDDASPAP